jgi:STE24 endopeptidase
MRSFDPQAATAAWIDSLGPEALAKAAAYTAGNHWLLLWNLLVSALIAWLIVRSRVLDRVDGKLGGRGPNVKAFVVAATYFIVANVLSLPWSIYEEWWREVAYGRTSQPLGDFLAQVALSVLIFAVLVALFAVGMYALVRRAGRYWWAWSGGLTAGALSIFLLAGPVIIEPLFNDFEPVPPGEVRDALVGMAREAGVPEDRIFVYDGSRQSNNFAANVSGIFGSARIAISDVAFKGASLDEVRAVTAHEIGHYVLGHVWRRVIVLSALAAAFFFVADRAFPSFARAFGSRVAISDPRGLPVLAFMVSLLFLLAQPIMNGMIRMGENEADQYSLETVNLPDGLASALVKTAEYRDPRPGRLQEFLFYTHPSVERRVRRAMEWKARHEPDGTLGALNPDSAG